MAAESFAETITWIVFLVMGVVLLPSLVLWVRRRRQEKMLIRRWCDGQGYAPVTMRPVNTFEYASIMPWVVNLLVWWVRYQPAWQLTVYDSEGGEKTVVVRVRAGTVVEETWNP